MLLTRTMFPVAALGVILVALPSRGLMGQASLDETGQRRAAESYVTGLRLSADGSRGEVAGIGARLLWDAAKLYDAAPALARRAEVGVFGTYLPRQNLSGANVFTAYRLGVVGDVRLFEAPLAGMIDPFLSVGAGVWNSRSTSPFYRRSPLLKTSVTMLETSNTALELAPGAGVRVPFGPAAGMYVDVHDAMTFRGPARHNLAVATGLRFSF